MGLQACDEPLDISQRCLAHRNQRQGIDRYMKCFYLKYRNDNGGASSKEESFYSVKNGSSNITSIFRQKIVLF